MNHAKTFKLALLGGCALILSACGENKEEALTYESVEACTAAGLQDAATCQMEFEKAQQRHNEVAPRYARANQCYSDFGYDRCYSHRTSSGSIWLPFMVGYMLAPRGMTSVYSQPLYRPSSDTGRFYTASNRPIGAVSKSGRTLVRKSMVSKPQARTRTVSRGGFGARATSSGS
jgi:uncharacterized protein YgiB involved in biofilm formation